MSAADVADVLAGVHDPELGVDVVALGLIYGIRQVPGWTTVVMTTTSPDCPMGALLVERVEEALGEAWPGHRPRVTVTHDPPWAPGMLAGAARRQLGLD